uniref:Uncharacterized protein n=1 Tax=Timema douglasi TaxID=61478 RepID=A0A7R8Z4K3_TIMDO|nr:unnamed protein product [Timema douglasi]
MDPGSDLVSDYLEMSQPWSGGNLQSSVDPKYFTFPAPKQGYIRPTASGLKLLRSVGELESFNTGIAGVGLVLGYSERPACCERYSSVKSHQSVTAAAASQQPSAVRCCAGARHYRRAGGMERSRLKASLGNSNTINNDTNNNNNEEEDGFPIPTIYRERSMQGWRSVEKVSEDGLSTELFLESDAQFLNYPVGEQRD